MPSQESQPLLLLSPGDVSLFLSPKTEELCLWGHFPKGLAGKGKPILNVNAISHALGSLTVKGRLFLLTDCGYNVTTSSSLSSCSCPRHHACLAMMDCTHQLGATTSPSFLELFCRGFCGHKEKMNNRLHNTGLSTETMVGRGC